MSSTATTRAARTIRTEAFLDALVRAWLLLGAGRLIDAGPMLTELDARIGDGDHGINLARGMTKVREALAGSPAEPAAGADLRLAGRTLVSTVGGASGPLYGTLLLEAGAALGGEGSPGLASALRAGVHGVARRGRSTTGQKTMLDALVPAVGAMEASLAAGDSWTAATSAAADAARAGAEATRPMIAQRGRASYLGERSAGHLDPGAASSSILIGALAEAASQLEALGSSPPNASLGSDTSPGETSR